MIFITIIAILFLGVVFFHYLQGFFSSLISAILSVFAAVLAFSYHESLVETLLQGRAANVAHGMALVTLFAAIYLVLRVLFDKLVPNGVMLPAIVDKIGGATMGIVAAIFATGTVAIACEELPWGSNVGWFTPYITADNNAQVPSVGSGQNQSGFVYDELHSQKAGEFDETDRVHFFPTVLAGVDEMVTATVSHLSDGGSLQAGQPLSHIHPDFLQEIYGQNIGIQGGAKHVAVNLPGKPPMVSVMGVFVVENEKGENDDVNLFDGEPSLLRKQPPVTLLQSPKEKKFEFPMGKGKAPKFVQYANLRNHAEKTLAVVRIGFSADAADTDGMIRLSPGSIRLVAKKSSEPGSEFHNYYPIGMLEPSLSASNVSNLYVDKLDDYLILDFPTGIPKVAVDAVFVIDRAVFEKGKTKLVDDDIFIEVKRMFRDSLAGLPVKRYLDSWMGNGKDFKIGTLHQQRPNEVKLNGELFIPPLPR
jgi:hypothetical protein